MGFPDGDLVQPNYVFTIAEVAFLPQLSCVKVVYLGGCNTCLDANGAGLPAALVGKGAHAAVGWRVSINWSRAQKYRVHQVFWEKLAGITVEEKRLVWCIIGRISLQGHEWYEIFEVDAHTGDLWSKAYRHRSQVLRQKAGGTNR
ncbi:MAG: hypothetical protein KatS3mg022_3123 [Armatimonadota bacterium]|nr:MAG: hypothetical protein KatS3mg022_3123 [Armatimonadota bacterium]